MLHIMPVPGSHLAVHDSLELPDCPSDALGQLAQAFGERLGVAAWAELRELEREPPPLEADHPALAVYVSEQLDNLGDDDPNFGASERAQVERALATVAAALSGAVREAS